MRPAGDDAWDRDGDQALGMRVPREDAVLRVEPLRAAPEEVVVARVRHAPRFCPPGSGVRRARNTSAGEQVELKRREVPLSRPPRNSRVSAPGRARSRPNVAGILWSQPVSDSRRSLAKVRSGRWTSRCAWPHSGQNARRDAAPSFAHRASRGSGPGAPTSRRRPASTEPGGAGWTTVGRAARLSPRLPHEQLERIGCGTETTITPVRVAPTRTRSPLARNEARIGPTMGSRTGIVRTRW